MTFALPKRQRRALQKPASPDVNLPLKEANVRIAAAGAVGEVAGATANLMKRYADAEKKREFRDAALALHTADQQFQRSYGGRAEYNAMEIEDANFLEMTSGSDPEMPVPAHTVYAEWRDKNYTDAMQKASMSIRDEDARAGFTAMFEERRQTNYTKDTLESAKQQRAYATSTGINAMEGSLRERDYGGARLGIALSDMPREAKEKAILRIDTQQQSDYFNDAIENLDLKSMAIALKRLGPGAENKRFNSNLDAQTQKSFANQLRAGITSAKAGVSSVATAQLKEMTFSLKEQIDDLWAGNQVNGIDMKASMAALKISNPNLVHTAQRSIDYAHKVRKILTLPPAVQTAQLDKLDMGAKGDLDKQFYADKLREGIAKGYTARAKDTLKYGKDIGFVKYKPLDYSSNENFIASLQARVKPVLGLQNTYGTFTGFLEVGELEEFGTRLENAPNQLAFLQNINSALGRNAESFYEQLKKYGIGDTAALAGQIASWGPDYEPVATSLLKGAKLRKDDELVKLQMEEVNSELESYAVKAFGGMFVGSPETRSLMVDGLKSVYAVTGNKEEAFQQLTGGSIEFNSYKIQAPEPGMSGRQYKSWLYNLSPDYWSRPDMKIYGTEPADLRQGLIEGTIRQEGIGKGVTQLVTANDKILRRADGKTIFLFKYDKDADNMDAWRRRKKQAKVKAAMDKYGSKADLRHNEEGVGI
jgi:hypothetical protein